MDMGHFWIGDIIYSYLGTTYDEGEYKRSVYSRIELKELFELFCLHFSDDKFRIKEDDVTYVVLEEGDIDDFREKLIVYAKSK